GQREAAYAVGLSSYQTFTKIIFPQAMRVVLPPMISQYLNLTKNSSLATLAGYAELFVIAQVISNQTGAAIPIALILIGSYLAISLAFSFVLNNVNARLALVER
ncbi:MAG: ABC transporter permease subunit, partial [Trueperaceae bacterium]